MFIKIKLFISLLKHILIPFLFLRLRSLEQCKAEYLQLLFCSTLANSLTTC